MIKASILVVAVGLGLSTEIALADGNVMEGEKGLSTLCVMPFCH
jgi:hypothetical protein